MHFRNAVSIGVAAGILATLGAASASAQTEIPIDSVNGHKGEINIVYSGAGAANGLTIGNGKVIEEIKTTLQHKLWIG